MEHAQPNLTLNEVCDHFQLWRDTRKSQRERIPDDLIAEAASLLDRYPQADILRELGLNRKRLLGVVQTRVTHLGNTSRKNFG